MSSPSGVQTKNPVQSPMYGFNFVVAFGLMESVAFGLYFKVALGFIDNVAFGLMESVAFGLYLKVALGFIDNVAFGLSDNRILHSCATAMLVFSKTRIINMMLVRTRLPFLGITPAARAALEWRRSRNGKDVAVTAIVRIHHTHSSLRVYSTRGPLKALASIVKRPVNGRDIVPVPP